MAVGLTKNGFLLKTVQIITTFILVDFAWIFFRANNFKDAKYVITHLFYNIPEQIVSVVKNQNFSRHTLLYLNQSTIEFLIAITAIVFMESVHYFQRNKDIRVYFSTKPAWYRWATYILLIYAIILFGVFSNKSFIYFQF